MNRMAKYSATACFLSLFGSVHAGDYREIEHPPSGTSKLIKDSYVVEYSADDFTDKIEEAKVLFIPQDFRSQAAFFLRCRPYYTNFSVQFLEQEDALKNRDGSLTNESAKFAKHGYVYNTKHDLKLISSGNSATIDADVGGQTNHLTQLFKTDVEKTSGLLGMSFHFTFNYTEMPDFRSASNTSAAITTFNILTQAIQSGETLTLQLDGRQAPDRTFILDTQRMRSAVPQEVLEFCLLNRQLIDD